MLFPFFLLNQLIDHFTDVWVVAWPLNKSETGGGFLVSKENVILLRWESETKIWFYQTNYLPERFRKLMFQALGLCQSDTGGDLALKEATLLFLCQ